MSTPRKKKTTKKPVPVAAPKRPTVLTEPAISAEVRELILAARQQVAQAVNARLTVLHGRSAIESTGRSSRRSELTTALKLCHHCRHNWRQSSDGDSAAGISST